MSNLLKNNYFIIVIHICFLFTIVHLKSLFITNGSATNILPDGIICERLGLYNVSINLAEIPVSIQENTCELIIDNSNIANPELFGRFKKIKLLSLNNVNLNILSSIMDLKLEFLRASNMNIRDISPLKTITTLKTLDISSTNVSDLSPLIGISLRQLNISNTPAAKLPLPKGLKVKHLIK